MANTARLPGRGIAPSMFPARTALNREPCRRSGMPQRSTRRATAEANPALHSGPGTHPSVQEEAGLPSGYVTRSEEHTSELQSLMRISYAVFCLQKKQKN